MLLKANYVAIYNTIQWQRFQHSSYLTAAANLFKHNGSPDMLDSTAVTVQHCHITYTLLILLKLARHLQNRLSVLLLQQLSLWTCFTSNNKHCAVLRTIDKLIFNLQIFQNFEHMMAVQFLMEMCVIF